jgi:hypothetical protein
VVLLGELGSLPSRDPLFLHPDGAAGDTGLDALGSWRNGGMSMKGVKKKL